MNALNGSLFGIVMLALGLQTAFAASLPSQMGGMRKWVKERETGGIRLLVAVRILSSPSEFKVRNQIENDAEQILQRAGLGQDIQARKSSDIVAVDGTVHHQTCFLFDEPTSARSGFRALRSHFINPSEGMLPVVASESCYESDGFLPDNVPPASVILPWVLP